MPLFAACNSEEDATVPGGEPQEVQVSISTRATADGDEWIWQSGDVTGLQVTGYDNTTSSYTLSYTGSAWYGNRGISTILPGTTTVWYPGGDGTSATSFTIPVNQTTNVNLCKADFMTYSGDLISTTPSVTLEHRLSKVIVTITDWSDYGSAMPTVTDFHIQTKESITVNGSTVTGDGNTIDIFPLQDEAAHSYTAIVAPNAGFNITLVVAGKDKTASYTGSLASGNAYSFNLTLKDTNALDTRSAGTSDCELELVEVKDMNEE
ncbi:hypothetical protein B5F77_00770 [Parabacteroides sp. An277]|nr:hypothetical protein B5F77_00770 [Parabacteroides sp. An277]